MKQGRCDLIATPPRIRSAGLYTPKVAGDPLRMAERIPKQATRGNGGSTLANDFLGQALAHCAPSAVTDYEEAGSYVL
jgi:hypothetical protein